MHTKTIYHAYELQLHVVACYYVKVCKPRRLISAQISHPTLPRFLPAPSWHVGKCSLIVCVLLTFRVVCRHAAVVKNGHDGRQPLVYAPLSGILRQLAYIVRTGSLSLSIALFAVFARGLFLSVPLSLMSIRLFLCLCDCFALVLKRSYKQSGKVSAFPSWSSNSLRLEVCWHTFTHALHTLFLSLHISLHVVHTRARIHTHTHRQTHAHTRL
jgi:hypothetical protein